MGPFARVYEKFKTLREFVEIIIFVTLISRQLFGDCSSMAERWSVDPKVAGSNLVIRQICFIKMQGSQTSSILLKHCR